MLPSSLDCLVTTCRTRGLSWQRGLCGQAQTPLSPAPRLPTICFPFQRGLSSPGRCEASHPLDPPSTVPKRVTSQSTKVPALKGVPYPPPATFRSLESARCVNLHVTAGRREQPPDPSPVAPTRLDIRVEITLPPDPSFTRGCFAILEDSNKYRRQK